MKGLFILNFILFSFFANADYWTQKADFGGTVRQRPVYFAIGNKGYIGTGSETYPIYHFRKDFWEYNPSTNVWTQKSDFGGSPRYTAIGFSIGTKGYVGTGWDQVTPFYNDFWEYDQITNIWTQKGNFPGVPRQDAICFTINSKAYAGLGLNGNLPLSDFYIYNDTTDTWIQLTNFVGAARYSAFAFGMNGKGYVGTGSVAYPNFAYVNDVWEYDPLFNAWTQKANFPGLPRWGTAYFTINNRGYVGMGGTINNCYSDFYEYNSLLNTWIQRANYGPPVGYNLGGGFGIGSYGYTGCGWNASLILSKEFWQYTPDSTTGIEELPVGDLDFTISPNPVKAYLKINLIDRVAEIKICDAAGKEVMYQNSLKSEIVNLNFLAKGIYFVELSNGKQKAVKKFVKE
jgi:N-acetylneuraminic acid mutarotase